MPAATPALSDAPLKQQGARETLRTAFGPVEIVHSARDIAPEIWERSFAGHCRDARFYEIVEETLRGQFDYRYFVFANEQTGARAVQPFFFVDQDIIAGSPRWARKAAGAVRKKFPRFLTMRMLMVGCAAGEGQLGSHEPWFVEALHETLAEYGDRSGASLVMLKDFPATYRDALAPFSSNGYRRVPSMPAATTDLSSFTGFEDYLQRKLSKVFRKNLRRKFKKLDEQPAITMEVLRDAAPVIDEIYPLYRQTFTRSEFQFEELTKDYLLQLGRRMPDRARFFLWRQNGKLIAFNVCLVHEGVLYDLDIGLDYSVALDLHLYFVTWRDVVQWSIEQGLRMYHTGPLNYDPKLHLRLRLAPQDIYARHTSTLLNPLFRIAIQYLQPARHDATLAKFPNAGEME